LAVPVEKAHLFSADGRAFRRLAAQPQAHAA
jgi:hypothetical protein